MFALPVLGAQHHQATLEKFCGGRHQDGIQRYCSAVLAPINPHDRNAVIVTIQKQEVGFLEPGLATDFLRAMRKAGYVNVISDAAIVRGWDLGADNRGIFGVRLDAHVPFRLQSIRDWRWRSQMIF